MISTIAKLAFAGALATGLTLGFEPLKATLHQYTNLHVASSGYFVLAGASILVLAIFSISGQLSLLSQFVWQCFLQPLGKHSDQAGRLNRFYQGQAESTCSFPALHSALI